MGYHVIDPGDLEPAPDRPCDQRPVAAAAGLGNLGLNRYVADPGEVFAAEPTSQHRASDPAAAEPSASVFAVGAPAVDDAVAYDGDVE